MVFVTPFHHGWSVRGKATDHYPVPSFEREKEGGSHLMERDGRERGNSIRDRV